jgi:hypothetical protein
MKGVTGYNGCHMLDPKREIRFGSVYFLKYSERRSTPPQVLGRREAPGVSLHFSEYTGIFSGDYKTANPSYAFRLPDDVLENLVIAVKTGVLLSIAA